MFELEMIGLEERSWTRQVIEAFILADMACVWFENASRHE